MRLMTLYDFYQQIGKRGEKTFSLIYSSSVNKNIFSVSLHDLSVHFCFVHIHSFHCTIKIDKSPDLVGCSI